MFPFPCPLRKALRELHQQKVTCTDLALVGQARTEIEASKFEEMEWKLFKEKMKSDIQAMVVFRSKLECHETLLYHAKLDHTRKRRLQGRDAVEELFKGAVPKFSFIAGYDQMLNCLLQLQREYRVESLPVRVVVNWASPSTVRDEQVALQMQVLQCVLGQEGFEPMGLVVMPVWERAKGSLYKAESLLLKSLSEKELNLDEKASLSFQETLQFLYVSIDLIIVKSYISDNHCDSYIQPQLNILFFPVFQVS